MELSPQLSFPEESLSLSISRSPIARSSGPRFWESSQRQHPLRCSRLPRWPSFPSVSLQPVFRNVLTTGVFIPIPIAFLFYGFLSFFRNVSFFFCKGPYSRSASMNGLVIARLAFHLFLITQASKSRRVSPFTSISILLTPFFVWFPLCFAVPFVTLRSACCLSSTLNHCFPSSPFLASHFLPSHQPKDVKE